MIDIPATGWRLPDDAIDVITTLVYEHKPALILECGSGRSTVALALAAGTYGGRVVSLEHREDYYAETLGMLEHADVTSEVRLAPIEPHGGNFPPNWYAREAWEGLDGIGMLMVDGPPSAVGKLARLPAVPLLQDQLLPGCVVVLDDAQRPDEKAAIEKWGIKMTLVQHSNRSWIAWGILP